MPVDKFQWIVIAALAVIIFLLMAIGRMVSRYLETLVNCAEKLNFRFGFTDKELADAIREKQRRDIDLELDRRIENRE